jgi:GDPmannose 4,6-dehydratase
VRVLIIGITGQDGSLLASHLIKRNKEVHGTVRTNCGEKFWRIDELGIRDSINFHTYAIGDESAFSEIIQEVQPDEIYSLAGESFTALSFENPKRFVTTNIESVIEQLEEIRKHAPAAKVFFAGSSEVFGKSDPMVPLNELSEFHPSTPYGVSKLAQLHLVRLYREKYDLQLFTGILFAHESPQRSPEFVTRKITIGLTARHLLAAEPLQLGDLSVSRDWGYAGDFVAWMNELLERGVPEEYLFGTGINTSIETFLTLCSSELDLDLEVRVDSGGDVTRYFDRRSQKLYVVSDRTRYGANRFSYGPANAEKLFSIIGTKPITDVPTLAKVMMKTEILRSNRNYQSN